METDPGRADDELLAEVDELRRENSRLRGLRSERRVAFRARRFGSDWAGGANYGIATCW